MEIFKEKKFQYLVAALLSVLPLEALSFFSIHMPWFVEYPFFTILMVLFGRYVFKSGIESLFHLNFSDINLLMTIGVSGAVYLGQLEEAVIIVILFAVAEVLEEFGIKRSQKALEDLVDKTPKTALLKGKEEKIPIESVKIGDIIIVKPGDQVPLDGKVIKGVSLVDEATITGEPLPNNKTIGDLVYAGTLNGSGYLEFEVTKTAKDTTLAKIIDLTFAAAEKKSQAQQFIEKFASYYTPAVIFAALLIFAIPVLLLNQPVTPWLTQALTLLIISCPCALVISTPISIFSAIGNATKKGILIKGGRFLEEMGKIKAVAFDKTRTITKGEPIVSDVVPFNSFTKENVLACASGIESLSEHPLAKSIIKKAEELQLDSHKYSNFEAVPGKGVKGNCAVCVDKYHCLGTLKFITQEHKVEKQILKQVEKFEQEGKTTIIMTEGKKTIGVIAITDTIREESKATVDQLKKLGITSIILTGDNPSSAQFVASLIGIDNVKAALLPDQKVQEVDSLKRTYKYVAMIGDGVNDAPALTSSSVGIAMGAIGSDIAVENADIALMNNNLSLLPFLVALGRKTNNTIRINTAMAVGTKFIFLGLAVVGMSNLSLAIFADVGMTIVVVVYSLRLFHFEYLPNKLR